MNSVSASGKYELASDTLLFFYNDRNYDSIVNVIEQKNVTLSQALGLPKKLLWKKKRLYVTAGDIRLKYAKLVN